MKKRFLLILLTIMLIVLLFIPPLTYAKSQEVKKVEAATEVLKQIMAIPEKGIPPSLLRNAKAIAIIPSVIKVGFVIGGRFGRGVILVRTDNGEWSNPVFITITGGSFGWQIGAKSTDIMLVFKTRKSIDNIKKGKVTLGADVAVAAGPVGRHAEAGTDIQLKAEIYSYSRSRGLFAGISLEGAAIQIDDSSNADFYDSEYISFRDIVESRDVKTPASAKRLKELLARYAK